MRYATWDPLAISSAVVDDARTARVDGRERCTRPEATAPSMTHAKVRRENMLADSRTRGGDAKGEVREALDLQSSKSLPH